jgi:hypothetical protein
MIYTFEPIIFSHIIDKRMNLKLKSYQIHAWYVIGYNSASLINFHES